MITNLIFSVLQKHGPVTLSVDKTGRIGIRKIEESEYRYWSFGINNCFIRMLAEDKK